jgi:hypothetical protein
MKKGDGKPTVIKVLRTYRKLRNEFTMKDILHFNPTLTRLSVYYYIKKLLTEGTLKKVKEGKGRGHETSYRFIK